LIIVNTITAVIPEQNMQRSAELSCLYQLYRKCDMRYDMITHNVGAYTKQEAQLLLW